MREPNPWAAAPTADRSAAPPDDGAAGCIIADVVDIAPCAPQQQQQHPAAPVWPAKRAARSLDDVLVVGIDSPVDPRLMDEAVDPRPMDGLVDPNALVMDGLVDPNAPVVEPAPIVALPPAVAPVDVDDTGGVSGVSDDAGVLAEVEPLPLFAPIDCIT